jgi:lipoprotein-releasing system ATP-binding protein
MSSHLVVVEKLQKDFVHEGRTIPVLKGIDLTVDRGEMLAVVGPSGAGKSTLLHIMGTLDLPTSGRILYEDEDVTRYSRSRVAEFRNRSLGFVFQFHHLLPEFTALENVMMPGLIRRERRSETRKRAAGLLEEVGLSQRVTHRPGELSGGEQQRVALARMEPSLVLADEPTGNLDTNTSKAMHDLLCRLNEQRGTTFLIVTHSQDLADKMGRVVHMLDGRIVDDGPGAATESPGETGPKTPNDAAGEPLDPDNQHG